jgi:uncharacterized protein
MDAGMKRDISGVMAFTSHAVIVTGIRRCGKSTLLQQIIKETEEESLYLNFEDPRLAGFDLSDFNRLQEIIISRGVNFIFFDEVQNVKQWENFVRFRLDEGYRIFITGSNASMLSRELGTRLTGRHIPRELFPFSYQEFLSFKGLDANVDSAEVYLKWGGFPEMLKTDRPEVLMHVFNDIVVRDIALRYGIKNTSVIQQLAVWLVSGPGKPVSGNSLRKIFDIGSSSSIMEYLSHLSEAYLFFFIPKFSYSQKVQIINPKKVYTIDNGLITANSISFSSDHGRLLENMVFMHLRRTYKSIFYFSEKKECDFVVFGQGKKPSLYQVCWQLDEETLERELSGIVEAMDFFGVKEGVIITHDQTDSFVRAGKTIKSVPFYKWSTTD